MGSRICLLSTVVFVWLCAHGVAVPEHMGLQPLTALMPAELMGRIEALGRPPNMIVQNETLRAPDAVIGFYERRGFRPVWLCDEGLLPEGEELVQVIGQAEREGLPPSGYHLSSIEQLIAELGQHDSYGRPQHLRFWVDLELLLTDAFFIYGSHVLTGQIDPRHVQEVWFVDRPQVSLETALQQVTETGLVTEFLRNLRPPHVGYVGLQKALAVYRDISARGGWPVIPDGPKLQRGDRDRRVATLRHRLRLTWDLDEPTAPVDDVFDAAVERGVQKFQQRHGLDADGVVGPTTLTALNIPVEARVRQIELNMERWRWLPQTLGEHYILVNIANFTLNVVEHGQSVLAMRAIVGKPARRTPPLSADMTYLVLNPHWNVPPTIAVQDKLPLIRRNPAYVGRQNFKLFQHGAGGMTRVDPMSVDWSSVNDRNFPYQLRQDPGPRNALGRVKFMFPNPYHVYLHDTPSRELFAKAERAFSSGCIRLEKPIELAEYLLREDPQWSRQKILASIARGTEQVVQLPTSIPVHLLYWTAWANEDGVVHFYKDIYERDKVLGKALQEVLPPKRNRGKTEVAFKHS